MHVYLGAFLKLLKFLFHVIYSLCISVILFLFPYLTPKLISLFLHPIVCLHAFDIEFFAEFYSFILEGPVSFVLFNSILVSFESHFFRPYLLIYLFYLYCHACLLFCLSFLSQYILVRFSLLNAFACCRYFLICPSSLISNPGFVFLFEFLREYRFYH